MRVPIGSIRIDLDRGYRSRPPFTHRIARLLQTEVDTLGDENHQFVDRLTEAVPGLSTVVDLVGRLTSLLRRQSTESSAAWFIDAAATPVARFATPLHRDVDALAAAINRLWTTSPMEGQISRLKMIKRTMYGRAGFEPERVTALAWPAPHKVRKNPCSNAV